MKRKERRVSKQPDFPHVDNTHADAAVGRMHRLAEVAHVPAQSVTSFPCVSGEGTYALVGAPS
jgi:hypothetical protein